jgi:hypothetical protein
MQEGNRKQVKGLGDRINKFKEELKKKDDGFWAKVKAITASIKVQILENCFERVRTYRSTRPRSLSRKFLILPK